MSVLCVILGIILIFGGVACLFTPLATLLSAGYIIGILLLVFGIFSIIRAIQEKGGVLDWILSILAIIVGIVAMVRPGGSLVIDTVLVYLLIAFFLVEGVLQICIAFKSKAVNKGWYWNLIAGIICVIVGIICLIQPMVAAVTIGILIAFIFIAAGFSLIALGTSDSEAE